MMELLIKAVTDGVIGDFSITYPVEICKRHDEKYVIQFTIGKGHRQVVNEITIEQLIKESREFELPNLEIALSQHVSKLLKEFEGETK